MMRMFALSLFLAVAAVSWAVPAHAGERVTGSRVVPCADTEVGRKVCGGRVTSSGERPSAGAPADVDRPEDLDRVTVRLEPGFFQDAQSGGVGREPAAYYSSRGRVVVVGGASARASASASVRVSRSGCGCR